MYSYHSTEDPSAVRHVLSRAGLSARRFAWAIGAWVGFAVLSASAGSAATFHFDATGTSAAGGLVSETWSGDAWLDEVQGTLTLQGTTDVVTTAGSVTLTEEISLSGAYAGGILTGASGTSTLTACSDSGSGICASLLALIGSLGTPAALPAVDDPILFALSPGGISNFAIERGVSLVDFSLANPQNVPAPSIFALLASGGLAFLGCRSRGKNLRGL